MRVLLISLFSHMPHHVGTELELLQRHIDVGDELTVLACMGKLPACLHKVQDKAVLCRECTTTRSHGLQLLDRPPAMFALDAYYTDSDRQREESIQTKFDSIDEVRDYKIDGFDIGYAAFSSTVSVYRDAYLDSEESKELISRMLIAGYRTYCCVREFLRVNNADFDRVYIFNGRFATCRGALRACEQAGLDVHIHERGSDCSKFMIYEHGLPHDLTAMDDRIRAKWEQATERDREQANGFFDQRRDRVEKFWFSHTKAQQAGRLPSSWDPSKRNVAIFTSSDDEYVAIGKEWMTPGFQSQSQAILDLYSGLRAKDSDIQLYVRMHPNLRGIDNRDTRLLYSLEGEGVELIRPESDVCSYAVMDNSEKIVTFGSTIGVEATYWGKPSILAGMSFYRALEAAYIAGGPEELLQLVEAQLEPRPKQPALMFGYYMNTFGEPYRYYKSSDFEKGTYRGTPLRHNMGYSLFGFLLPKITRTFGMKPMLRERVERFAYALAHLPFVLLYELASPLAKVDPENSTRS